MALPILVTTTPSLRIERNRRTRRKTDGMNSMTLMSENSIRRTSLMRLLVEITNSGSLRWLSMQTTLPCYKPFTVMAVWRQRMLTFWYTSASVILTKRSSMNSQTTSIKFYSAKLISLTKELQQPVSMIVACQIQRTVRSRSHPPFMRRSWRRIEHSGSHVLSSIVSSWTRV